MNTGVFFRNACRTDAERIASLLYFNLSSTSLFQQPLCDIQRNILEFVLAEDGAGSLIGCTQIHWFPKSTAEILAVAVHPESQGRGVGIALMMHCIDSVLPQNPTLVWLATAKPRYFGRFGFEPISKWELPRGVLHNKVLPIFRQPVVRWIPALTGRHTFMKLNVEKYRGYVAEERSRSG